MTPFLKSRCCENEMIVISLHTERATQFFLDFQFQNFGNWIEDSFFVFFFLEFQFFFFWNLFEGKFFQILFISMNLEMGVSSQKYYATIYEVII